MLNSVLKNLLIFVVFFSAYVVVSIGKVNALYIDIDRDFNSNNNFSLLSEVSQTRNIFIINNTRYSSVNSQVRGLIRSLPNEISFLNLQQDIVLKSANFNQFPINKDTVDTKVIDLPKILSLLNIQENKGTGLLISNFYRKVNLTVTLLNTKISSSLAEFSDRISKVNISVHNIHEYESDINNFILTISNLKGDYYLNQNDSLFDKSTSYVPSDLLINSYARMGYFNNKDKLVLILPRVSKTDILPINAISNNEEFAGVDSFLDKYPSIVHVTLAIGSVIDRVSNGFSLMEEKSQYLFNSKGNNPTKTVDGFIADHAIVTFGPINNDFSHNSIIESENIAIYSLVDSDLFNRFNPSVAMLVDNLYLSNNGKDISYPYIKVGEVSVDKEGYLEYSLNKVEPIGIVAGASTSSIVSISVPPTVPDTPILDITPPLISIIGKTPLKVFIGFKYNELGAISVDNEDGDLTSKITISGNVNTSILGEYNIYYTVVDKSGNSAKVTRVVNVVPQNNRLLNSS